MAHYRRPDWFTKHVLNPAVAGLTRLGVSVAGSRVLEVRGRKSGECGGAHRSTWESGQFFAGTGPDSTDEELLRIAPDHPAFRLTIRA